MSAVAGHKQRAYLAASTNMADAAELRLSMLACISALTGAAGPSSSPSSSSGKRVCVPQNFADLSFSVLNSEGTSRYAIFAAMTSSSTGSPSSVASASTSAAAACTSDSGSSSVGTATSSAASAGGTAGDATSVFVTSLTSPSSSNFVCVRTILLAAEAVFVASTSAMRDIDCRFRFDFLKVTPWFMVYYRQAKPGLFKRRPVCGAGGHRAASNGAMSVDAAGRSKEASLSDSIRSASVAGALSSETLAILELGLSGKRPSRPNPPSPRSQPCPARRDRPQKVDPHPAVQRLRLGRPTIPL